MEKHSTEWCDRNPAQAAADLYTLKLAVANAKRLLRSDQPHDREEAMTWLTNAAKI